MISDTKSIYLLPTILFASWIFHGCVKKPYRSSFWVFGVWLLLTSPKVLGSFIGYLFDVLLKYICICHILRFMYYCTWIFVQVYGVCKYRTKVWWMLIVASVACGILDVAYVPWFYFEFLKYPSYCVTIYLRLFNLEVYWYLNHFARCIFDRKLTRFFWRWMFDLNVFRAAGLCSFGFQFDNVD